MLFVELILIRWAGSNIYQLFFFSNFILLASFLGIGIGFLNKSERNWFFYSPILLAFVILFCYFNGYEYQAKINPLTDNLDYSGSFFKDNSYPIALSLPIIFSLVTLLMASIGHGVAKLFNDFSPLIAYRFEIMGSLLGVMTFFVFSFFHLGPAWWGMVIFLCYLPSLSECFGQKRYLNTLIQILMLMLMFLVLLKETLNPYHYWSSYSKIEVQPYAGNRYVVNVNGLAQQIIESIDQRRKVKPFYFTLYEQAPKNKQWNNVLIIGAGTGGDVAIALSKGAKRVDAVEIDPMLYALGKKFNPDHPYDDKRVHIYIEDGRSFLQRNHKKYDLIIYALTDSLHLISGQSSLRLENYLYTLQGLTSANDHLNSDGIFTIYNYYGASWLIDRLANTLAIIYKHSPCLTTSGPNDYWATVLSISKKPPVLQCKSKWQKMSMEHENPITDNYPFLYLEKQTIPFLYLVGLFWVLAFSFVFLKIMKISYLSITHYADLFCMGAAFLLLETKNIINFALFFGTTWMVNALVFMGMLLTIYVSIELSARPIFCKKWILYPGLLLSLLIGLGIPPSWILSLNAPLRFVAASAIGFMPLLMANLLFAKRFQEVNASREAFGINLIGAVLGGVLEYSSLAIGYQNLFLIIICLYLFSGLWSRMRPISSFS